MAERLIGAVRVLPLYAVQIGEKTLIIDDTQANDLFVALNGLFGENPALTQRVEEIETLLDNWADLDAQVYTMQEKMDAIEVSTQSPPPALNEARPIIPRASTRPDWESPPFEADETEQVRALISDGKASSEIAATLDRTVQSVRREIERIAPKETASDANPCRVPGQGLTERGVAKLREMGNRGLSARDMAAEMGIPKGSVEYYLSKYEMRGGRTWNAPTTPEIMSDRRKSVDVREHQSASGTPWSASDDATIVSTMKQGGTLSQAALLLKRTGAEVRERWKGLCKEGKAA